MDSYLYFTVLVNKASFACVLFMAVPSVDSSILIDLQFRSEKKKNTKLLVTLSFVGAVKRKYVSIAIFRPCVAEWRQSTQRTGIGVCTF